MTSTAAMFHRWLVGAVAMGVTSVPAEVTAAIRRSTQKVSPTAVSTHWETIEYPRGSVLAVAPSQSLPTANTRERSAVVVSDTFGAPDAADATALVPPRPSLTATTVSVWS